MRLLTTLCLLAAVPTAVAGAAGPRSVLAPAPVSALAMDGRVVAFASGAGVGVADCDHVRLWNLTTRAVVTLGRTTTCEETSTGTGISAVTIAGTRVLWLHYTGGNIREWRLFTATTTRRAPRLLAFEARDVDEGSPLVLGPGDASRFGDILPYALGRTVTALRENGSRRFSWLAPDRVTALAALDGELAVASEGGVVTILDAAGRVLRTEKFLNEIEWVRLTGAGLLVQSSRTLELRAATTSTWSLPPVARLRDATAEAAYYTVGRHTVGGQVYELRLDGRGRRQRVAGGMDVQVELSTLALAAGRRVTVRAVP